MTLDEGLQTYVFCKLYESTAKPSKSRKTPSKLRKPSITPRVNLTTFALHFGDSYGRVKRKGTLEFNRLIKARTPVLKIPGVLGKIC